MRIIEGFPAYLLTETDRVVTKEGEIEVPIKDNKVTIKNEAGKEKTVSIGFLKEMSEEMPEGEVPAPEAEEESKEEESTEEQEEESAEEEEEAPKEEDKKDPPKGGKKSTDKGLKAVKKDPPKKETPKADKKPAASNGKPKGPGVIATIFECVSSAKQGKNGITEKAILAVLKKNFKDKNGDSMMKTIKAQIGSNKRPVRMEREKKVEFRIEAVKEVKHYSLKK